MAKLSPIGNTVTLNDSGNPASGWKWHTCAARSSITATTYTDEAGTVPHEAAIILNARGEPDSLIWLTEGVSYKFVLTDENDVVKRTVDNVAGVNDASLTIDQWINGPEPTYVSASSFTVSGDQTSALHVGRRVKCTTTGGTVFGAIETSAYTSLTTVTVTLDSGSLDSGLSAVYLGLITYADTSAPNATPRDRSVTVAKLAYFPSGHIAGLTLSNNATDANNDIDIAAGECVDSTNTEIISLASSITKRLDATWAAGTGNGGLDTGVKANNTWYHVWPIRKDSDGSVDALFSASASSPVMPSGYTAKRMIGSVLTDGSGNITPFVASEISGGGVETMWKSPALDVNLSSTLGAAARLDVIKAPTGYSVITTLNVAASHSTSYNVYVSSPLVDDIAPSGLAAPLSTIGNSAGTGTRSQARARTNASAQIRSRANLTIDSFQVSTLGWEWGRR